MWTWGAVGLAVAAVVACSEDQTVKNKSMTAPQDPSMVVTGPDEIDLVDVFTQVVNGATWNQAQDFKVGTGVINPFLSIQANGVETGFNTDGTFEYDQTRSNFTNPLPLNTVPTIVKAGTAYREFIMDANEANSAPDGQFSIDSLDIWLCADSNATDYTLHSDYRSNTACKKVYDLGGKTILATDANSQGSGSSFDYQILIPEQKFIDAANQISSTAIADCSYAGFNAPSCGVYIIVDAKMGGKGGDWVTGSTFEEFSTLKRPWVKVTKTATPSFTRKYKWQIDKSVTPTDITLFGGQSDSATFSINVTPGSPAYTDTLAVVNGTIKIKNTSGDTVRVISLTDAIPGYPSITPSCGVTFPHVINNNDSVTCTYSVTPPDTDPGAHTNTATATINAGADVDPSVFTGTAEFNFATATPTEIDKDPPVYDNYNGGGESQVGSAGTTTWPITYKKTYTCGEDQTYANVARVDITGTPDPTDSARVNIHCLSLTVTKTAAVTLRRHYLWTITKSVTPDSWSLFNGDQGTSRYTVTATPNGFLDSAQTASGNITIHNPNTVPVYIYNVADTISTGLNANVGTCQVSGADITLAGGYALAAGADIICPYSRTLPDNTVRTNTATVTAKPTTSGQSKTFTGQATVDPSTATLTEINKTVNVTDNYQNSGATALGTATYPDPSTWNPTRTFSCPDSAGTKTNIATITETGQADTASVTVNCYTLSVSKTAAPKWRKTWTWNVEKTISPTADSITLAENEPYVVQYTVTPSATSAIDSVRIDGTIAVSNTSPIDATINSVSDMLSVSGAATVSCGVTFPYTLVKTNGTLNCTYTKVLSDTVSQTNTATAVRQAYSYTYLLVQSNNGTVSYSNASPVAATFSTSPTEAVDECVTMNDTNDSTNVSGTVCAGDLPKTFQYQRTIQYAQCGRYTVPNTASLLTTAGTSGSSSNTSTGAVDSASVNIVVIVTCPPVQGCTLTQGYWKTHNVSFKGGAPPDDNWLNLPAAENTGFFTTWAPSYPAAGPNTPTSFTWFNVFWTPPKGNTYYQLAHQYMAAKLNILNGASDASISSAISAAETFLATYPATTNWSKGQKQQMTTWAGIFGSYNEGTLAGGPPHCSEDNTISSAP